jgi:Tol biopolymer transport system component
LRAGASEGWIGALIWGSPETYQLSGSTPGGYVDRLYRRALGREPDAAGRAHWVGEVRRRGRARVAHMFLMTAEARGGRAGEVVAAVLQRDADTATRAYWGGRLTTITELRLVSLVADVPEVATRAVARCRAARVLGGGALVEPADPSLSADGRWLAYSVHPGGSAASEVHLLDLTTGATVQVGPGTPSAWNPDVSADGRYVAFVTQAPGEVVHPWTPASRLYVWDRITGITTQITTDEVELSAQYHGFEDQGQPSISADGSLVAFSGYRDGDDATDGTEVYLWERSTGQVRRLTEVADGQSAAPVLSGDGTTLVYSEWFEFVDDWPHLVRMELATGTASRIVDSDHSEEFASVSDDGRFVVFTSASADVIPGDPADFWHLYLWDAETGTTTRVSEGNDGAGTGSISGDGSTVVYDVYREAAGGTFDLVAHDLATGRELVVAGAVGTNPPNVEPTISADGDLLAFATAAGGIVPEDTDDDVDLFLWSRARFPLPS